MAEMVYQLAGRVHVACHRLTSPTDPEWRAYMADIGASLARIDAILVFAPGGGLTFAQTRESAAFWKTATRQPPIAVVTTSRAVARAAGALKWFMPAQIRAFGVWDAEAAWKHLGCDERQRRAAVVALQGLGAQMDVEIPGEWRVSRDA